jgi:cytochrome c5
MDESLFYIAGGALIAVALILSFIGMRSDKFPPDKLLVPGIALIALLVAVTAVGAVELAKHEQEHKLGEANAAADVKESAQTQTDQQAGAAPAPTPQGQSGGGSGGGGGSSGASSEGAKLFVSSGCGSCHSLSELGSDATGTIGPNLDTALVNRVAKFIEESIVDPSAYVAKGYPDGTMPSNFSDQLSQDQISAIVDFLVQSTSGGGSGSSGG